MKSLFEFFSDASYISQTERLTPCVRLFLRRLDFLALDKSRLKFPQNYLANS